MNPYKVWAAIILGAVSGCLMIAYAFSAFEAIFKANWIVGLVLLIVVIAVVAVYLIRKRNNAKEQGEGLPDTEEEKEITNDTEGKTNETEE